MHNESPYQTPKKGTALNIESLIGKFSITARNDDENALTIVAEKRETLASILNGVELIGGAFGEDQTFSPDDIEPFTLFGKAHFRITLSRAQMLRYFEYEILNFLEYKSLTQMRKLL